MSCSMVHREHDCLLSVDKEPANTKEGQRVPVVLYYSTSPVLVLATAYGDHLFMKLDRTAFCL